MLSGTYLPTTFANIRNRSTPRPPPAWRYGKMAGTLEKRKPLVRYRLRSRQNGKNKTKHVRSFTAKQHNNDIAMAHKAALAYQQQYCTENNLLCNRYRFVANNSIVEMQVKCGTTMRIVRFDKLHIETILKHRWTGTVYNGMIQIHTFIKMVGSTHRVRLHQFIGELYGANSVEHIDGNPLNNTLINLRSTERVTVDYRGELINEFPANIYHASLVWKDASGSKQMGFLYEHIECMNQFYEDLIFHLQTTVYDVDIVYHQRPDDPIPYQQPPLHGYIAQRLDEDQSV